MVAPDFARAERGGCNGDFFCSFAGVILLPWVHSVVSSYSDRLTEIH